MTDALTKRILSLSDAGQVPGAIAKALHPLPLSRVYAVLRKERPERRRAPRRRTSVVPTQVLALYAAGVGVGRIAALCQVSRAYIYRILQEATAAK